MARQMSASMLWATVLLLCQRALAHPCTAEVASACPDRPGSDMGACLKDKEQHDKPTTISSECTDFIALNKACAEDIEERCSGNYFHDDTLLCLTKWTKRDDLKEKCTKVLSWAAPEEKDEVVTDELGKNVKEVDKDMEEYKAKRKANREQAIERMKMKEADKKKEEERVALEKYKLEDPEGYKLMMEQQEEEKKQQEAFKRKERARMAAIERAKRAASGAPEDVNDNPDGGDNYADDSSSRQKGPEKARKIVKEEKGFFSTPLGLVCNLALIGGICYGIYFIFNTYIMPPKAKTPKSSAAQKAAKSVKGT